MVQNLPPPLLFSSLSIQEASNKPHFFYIFQKSKHFRVSIGTGKKTAIHWYTYINISTFCLISSFSFSRIKIFPFSLSLSFWAWILTLHLQKTACCALCWSSGFAPPLHPKFQTGSSVLHFNEQSALDGEKTPHAHGHFEQFSAQPEECEHLFEKVRWKVGS